MPDLLLELFSEEIPARMQARAADDLRRLVTDFMVEQGLTYEGAAAHHGPRRLVLDIRGLPARTPDRREERKGPRTDAPEKALEGFLRSTGVARDSLVARDDKKGAVWFAVLDIPGRPAAEVIAEAVTHAVRSFPWPKSMRWGSGSLRWVRPLQSILCILSDEAGTEIVPFEIDGIASGATTRGHRFMAPGEIAPKGFDDYAAKLEAAKVVVDAAERARRIEADAKTLAFAQGLELVEDAGLLAEVAGLVEWPVVLMGEIGKEFLSLPPEVLQTSMRTHQKFFSVKNPASGRIEKFITVANNAAPDGGATILAGNRRVLAARLSDARFFWENDLRVVQGKGEAGLAAMAAPLASVTFHSKLGTQADRVARIAALAREIAPKVGADPDLAEAAARVCKADLASAMVYEFPELQGTMGRYYAAAAGLPEAVCDACAEHYAPLGPSDAVPTAPVSVAVALADKLDTLTGFWAIDEKPTGSKDPFALRRAALGVIRTVLERGHRLKIDSLLSLEYNSISAFIAQRANIFVPMRAEPGKLSSIDRFLSFDSASETAWDFMLCARVDDPERIITKETMSFESHEMTMMPNIERFLGGVTAFLADRLKVALRDKGIRHDVIDACFRLGGQDDLTLLVRRVEALQAFLATEDGANLLAGFRRAANIVAQAEADAGPNVVFEGEPEPRLFREEPEHDLHVALEAAAPRIDAALRHEDFAEAMRAMAALRAPIDAFLDKVVVNADDRATRFNRLCLLNRVRQVMGQVAVFAAIEG